MKFREKVRASVGWHDGDPSGDFSGGRSSMDSNLTQLRCVSFSLSLWEKLRAVFSSMQSLWQLFVLFVTICRVDIL